MHRIIWFLIAALSLAGPAVAQDALAGFRPTVDPAVQFATSEYRIGRFDKVKITVFQVPDLSLDAVQVDAAGQVQVPLIGTVPAAGRTTAELAADVAARLGEKYLRSPQVSVIVLEAASQKVSVDGAVNTPGVFEMRGRTTLMQAVAMARGPSRDANLKKIAVFRTVSGQRMVAVFDLNAIRKGEAPDPEILGDDIIVVDSSKLKGALRDIMSVVPAFSIFRPF